MDVFKIAVKLFAVKNEVAPEQFVPVFHRWIQNQVLENHLMIDVADYAHVAQGPGTVLVTSQANVHIDYSENRPGLLYVRKLALPGSFEDRLTGVIAEAMKAAVKLENEPQLAGKISFSADEIVIRLNDRLLAPNNQETAKAVEGDIRKAAAKIYGGKPFTLETKINPLTPFEVRLKSSGSAPIKSLVDRMAAGTAA